MRVGSFKVNKDGQQADVSIIPLAGGNELDNVNRWRNQLGLPPIEASALAAAGEKVTIAGSTASLYDLAGSDPQSKQPTRILAAMLPLQGSTWFFKMIGPDGLVESQKTQFKAFLRSVRAGDASVGDMPPMPVSMAPASAPTPDLASIPGHESFASGKPGWTVPAGWQEQPPTSMRLATYLVKAEGGAKADVSVVKLGGSGGGMLPNVNRWRGQVGLKPVNEAELNSLITTKPVGDVNISILDMTGHSPESGEQARLLVAVVPRDGATWFYKMVGNDQLVAQQKEAFVNFVQSARYSNAP
jgi:hypothetical protein